MPGLSMLLLIILGMDAGAAYFGLGLRMGAVVEKQKEVEEGDLYGFYMDWSMNYIFSSSRIWEDDWTGCFRIFRRVTPRQMIAGVLSLPLLTWRHLFEGLQPWWFYDTWHIWNRVCKGYFGRSHNNTSPMTNVWHAASMCKSLGIPHAEKKDRLIHRKNGWSRVSRVKSKSHKDTPIKSC